MDNQYNPNNYNPNNYNPNNYNPNSYGTGPQQGNNPYYPRRPYDPYSEPMTLKDWLLTFLLLLIPFANIILPFYWAFASNVNRSKKTFFQAYLIWMLIGIVFAVIMIILFAALFASIFSGISDYYYY